MTHAGRGHRLWRKEAEKSQSSAWARGWTKVALAFPLLTGGQESWGSDRSSPQARRPGLGDPNLALEGLPPPRASEGAAK